MTGIEVMLGGDSGRCVFVSWRGAGGDAASAHEALQASRCSRRWGRNIEARQELDWDSLTMQHSTMWVRKSHYQPVSLSSVRAGIESAEMVLVFRIISRVPKISVQLSHQPPALTNEVYCIKLTVQSQEEAMAKDVKLTAGLKPGRSVL